MAVLIKTKSAFPYISLRSTTSLLKDGSSIFYALGGTALSLDTTTVEGQMTAYLSCPQVNSIVNKVTKAFMNGKWSLTDLDGNPMKNPKTSPMYYLFTQPNPLQTFNEFISQASTYLKVHGECFILPVSPTDKVADARVWWNIPNWMVTPVFTGKVFQQSSLDGVISGWKIGTAHSNFTVGPEELLQIRDTSVNLVKDLDGLKTINRGLSRLYPLGNVIDNIIGGLESRNVLIRRRGALGILSNDYKDQSGGLDIDPDEQKKVQEALSRYGLGKKDWQVIVTNASLKWQQIAMTVKDLMLLEEDEAGTRKVAEAYDYPTYLLGDKEGTTFTNMESAKKWLYTDAIIPDSVVWSQSFTSFLDLESLGHKVFIDYSHLEVLQKSKKEEAEWKKMVCDGYDIAYKGKIITREEWRQALGMDPDLFLGTTFYIDDTRTQK